MMKATRDDEHGVMMVQLTGELDALEVPKLRPALDRLLEQAPHRLVVDISGLRLLDSCGVGLLVYLFRRLRGNGHLFGVRGACEQPLSILRLMKLDQIFLEDAAGEHWHSTGA